MYVADYVNHQIGKITPSGAYSVFASLASVQASYSLIFNASTNELIGSNGSTLDKIARNGTITTIAAPTNVRTYLADYGTSSSNSSGALGLIRITPCRVVDTRPGQAPTGAFGAPSMAAGNIRTFVLPNGGCPIPATAKAYALNVTVVPQSGLSYLSLWPTGQQQPLVSTLNA